MDDNEELIVKQMNVMCDALLKSTNRMCDTFEKIDRSKNFQTKVFAFLTVCFLVFLYLLVISPLK